MKIAAATTTIVKGVAKIIVRENMQIRDNLPS
jgi:hypothetical protein